MSALTQFDTVTATAAELQLLLQSRAITSAQIINAYLDQIDKHNKSGLDLHALICVAPREPVLAIAKTLDKERANGKVRGPLHGLPIIVKDGITTGPDLGMDTTAGSCVFAGTKVKKNAAVIDQLIKSGMIILGKANMTEFCGKKDKARTPGWSAKGGQTRSAFHRPDLEEKDLPTCGGSSAGSGVGVSAGFAPLALGTDTAGSNVYPVSVAGLYGLNPTSGTVSMAGVFGISRAFDSVGAMARTSSDLAALVGAIMTPVTRSQHLSQRKETDSESGWRGVSIGFSQPTWGHVSADKWNAPSVKSRYEEVVTKIGDLRAHVVYLADLPDSSILTYFNACKDKSDIEPISFHEFKSVIEEFMTCFEDPKVSTLAELVEWNAKHAEEAMPEPYTDQEDIIRALNDPTSDEDCQAAVIKLKRLATESIDKYMAEHKVDMIAAPSDSTLVSFASCSGSPIATVPIGNLESNGQPFGIFLLAKAGQENALLTFMRLYEDASISTCHGPPGLA